MAAAVRLPATGDIERVEAEEGENGKVTVAQAVKMMKHRHPAIARNQDAMAQTAPCERVEVVLRAQPSDDESAPVHYREYAHAAHTLQHAPVVHDCLLERVQGVYVHSAAPSHWLASFTAQPELRYAKSARLEHDTSSSSSTAAASGGMLLTCRYGGGEGEKECEKQSHKRKRQFVGREEASASTHFALVRDGAGGVHDGALHALPCDRWVRFSPNVQRRQNQLTLEQAEARMSRSRKGGRKQAEKISEVAERNAEAEPGLAQQDADQLPEMLSDDEDESSDEEHMVSARADMDASGGNKGKQQQRQQAQQQQGVAGRGKVAAANKDDDDLGFDDDDEELKEPERGEDWEHGAVAGEASDDEEMELKEGQLKQQEESEEAGENKAKEQKLQQKLAPADGDEEADDEESDDRNAAEQQDTEIKKRAKQLGIEGEEEADEDEEEAGEDDAQDDDLPDTNPDQDTELADLLTTSNEPATPPKQQPSQQQQEEEQQQQQQQYDPTNSKKRPRTTQNEGAPKAKASKRETALPQQAQQPRQQQQQTNANASAGANADVSEGAVRQLLREKGTMTTKALQKEFKAKGALATQAATEQLKESIKKVCVMRTGSDGKRYLALPSE